MVFELFFYCVTVQTKNTVKSPALCVNFARNYSEIEGQEEEGQFYHDISGNLLRLFDQ